MPTWLRVVGRFLGVALVCAAGLAAGLAAGALLMADVLLWSLPETAAVGFAAAVVLLCCVGAWLAGESWLRTVLGVLMLAGALVAAASLQMAGFVGPPPATLAREVPFDEVDLVDGRPVPTDRLWLAPSRSWQVGAAQSPQEVLDAFVGREGWVVDREKLEAARDLPWGYQLRVSVRAGSAPGLGWPSTVELARDLPWAASPVSAAFWG